MLLDTPPLCHAVKKKKKLTVAFSLEHILFVIKTQILIKKKFLKLEHFHNDHHIFIWSPYYIYMIVSFV